MKTVGQMQTFLGNRDQHVSADRNPDLRLDPQVLLKSRMCRRKLAIMLMRGTCCSWLSCWAVDFPHEQFDFFAAYKGVTVSWRAKRGHPSLRRAVMDCRAALAVTGNGSPRRHFWPVVQSL